MTGAQANAPETRRRWTFKEIVQGKPIGHPSHAMFVHFPVAFYLGALGFDVASRMGHLAAAPLAATWLIIAGLAGGVLAAVTGLVDWWGMKPGSRARRTTNKHLTLQLGATIVFGADLALRWSHRTDPAAAASWIALGVLGSISVLIGQYFGGVLVYRIGFRVYDTVRKQPAKPEAAPGVAPDAVDLASDQSFPASDPPAY